METPALQTPTFLNSSPQAAALLRVSKALAELTKANAALIEADYKHKYALELTRPNDVSAAAFDRITNAVALACIEAATVKSLAELEMARACAEYADTFQKRYPERKIR